MKTLAEHLRVYAGYHQKRFTKLTHFIGVPLAILPILMLLNWVHLLIPGILVTPLSWPAYLALMIYYLRLDWRLALPLLLVFFVLNLIAIQISGFAPNLLGFLWLLGIFVLAWAIQLIGHWVEGRKPALLDNLFQALIAPLFLVAEVAFWCKLRQDLQ